ncbi:MAG: DUF3363 domain-containing protein, partial [Candidatus Omnitrophica bacterium]|nr:DUF3363 domain-containing protein [Candidatus Omnitrophota bacterium]
MLKIHDIEHSNIINLGSSVSKKGSFRKTTSLSRLSKIIGAMGISKKRIYGISNPIKQRSIVKFSYSVNKYGSQWKAQGKYLMRKNARGEERGFDRKNSDIDIAAELSNWQQAKDEVLYKIILSPEQGARIDLKDHARKLMDELEKDLRVKIQWNAVIHTNTDHKHVHIVLRGIDQAGKKIKISNGYRMKGLRLQSEKLLTREIGFRQKKDILEARQKVVYKNHITAIDRDIERLRSNKNYIRIDFNKKSVYQHTKSLQLVQRLDYLVDKGLAEKVERGLYTVKDDFLSVIKKEQVRHDIIKSLQAHKKNMVDKDLPFEHKYLDVKDHVIGRIVGVGVSDDVKDLRYIILEGVDGKAYRLDLTGKMLKERDKLSLKNGDILYMEKRMFEKDGKEIKYTHFR